MKCRSSVVLALTFVVGISCPCHADEDGFFCTSKGYLAYDLRDGSEKGLTSHTVKVVRFDSKGVYFAGKVHLQDFQVHRMTCEPDRIEISGYGSTFNKYEIGISEPNGPRISEFLQDPMHHFDPKMDGPEPLRFSQQQSEKQVISLDSDRAGPQYKLSLTHTVRAVKGGLEHRNRAEIVGVSPGGKVVRLVIYIERTLETID